MNTDSCGFYPPGMRGAQLSSIVPFEVTRGRGHLSIASSRLRGPLGGEGSSTPLASREGTCWGGGPLQTQSAHKWITDCAWSNGWCGSPECYSFNQSFQNLTGSQCLVPADCTTQMYVLLLMQDVMWWCHWHKLPGRIFFGGGEGTLKLA